MFRVVSVCGGGDWFSFFFFFFPGAIFHLSALLRPYLQGMPADILLLSVLDPWFHHHWP